VDHPPTPSPAAIEIIRGTGLPVVLSVPHSGCDYDPALIARSRLGRANLERLEDPLVDRLIAGALRLGGAAVIARTPRAVIDCNRAEEELDPLAIAGRSGEAPTARARAGLGLIPNRLATIGAIWREPLSEAGLAKRLAQVHRPYHAAIEAGLDLMSERWTEVVLIDCHSMPPRPPNEAKVVIGDRNGSSAAPWVSDAAAEVATRLGFSVARNVPFAGGHIVERHGIPSRGRHAIQIEIDRSCYCLRDARTAGPGFERVADLFEELTRKIGQLAAQPDRNAAE